MQAKIFINQFLIRRQLRIYLQTEKTHKDRLSPFILLSFSRSFVFNAQKKVYQVLNDASITSALSERNQTNSKQRWTVFVCWQNQKVATDSSSLFFALSNEWQSVTRRNRLHSTESKCLQGINVHSGDANRTTQVKNDWILVHTVSKCFHQTLRYGNILCLSPSSIFAFGSRLVLRRTLRLMRFYSHHWWWVTNEQGLK